MMWVRHIYPHLNTNNDLIRRGKKNFPLFFRQKRPINRGKKTNVYILHKKRWRKVLQYLKSYCILSEHQGKAPSVRQLKRWFLSQVGKAEDCNSSTVGSSPAGTSICLGGEIGRRTGLKILRTSNSVPVRLRPEAPFLRCASSSIG